jgi:hypothetical protein
MRLVTFLSLWQILEKNNLNRKDLVSEIPVHGQLAPLLWACGKAETSYRKDFAILPHGSLPHGN